MTDLTPANKATPEPSAPDARWTPAPFHHLSSLWRGEYRSLLSFARSLCDPRHAEDIVQSAVVRTMKRLTEPDAPTEPERQLGYLYLMVRDAAKVVHRRQQRRTARQLLITGPVAALRRLGDPERDAARRDVVKAVDHALASLPPRIAETFKLAWDHAASYEAIAGFLGITAAAARSNYSKACARLRQELEARGIDEGDLDARYRP